MTPNTAYVHEYKGYRGLHVNPLWNPFMFGQGEFWLTEEEQCEIPYQLFRKLQLADEQSGNTQ